MKLYYCFNCERLVEPLRVDFKDIGTELGCPNCKGGDVGEISNLQALELFKGQTNVPDEIVELREEYILAGIWEYDLTDEVAKMLVDLGEIEYLERLKKTNLNNLITE